MSHQCWVKNAACCWSWPSKASCLQVRSGCLFVQCGSMYEWWWALTGSLYFSGTSHLYSPTSCSFFRIFLLHCRVAVIHLSWKTRSMTKTNMDSKYLLSGSHLLLAPLRAVTVRPAAICRPPWPSTASPPATARDSTGQMGVFHCDICNEQQTFRWSFVKHSSYISPFSTERELLCATTICLILVTFLRVACGTCC